MITAAWLRKAELFSGLEEFQLNAILAHSSTESFPERKTIFRQGEEARRLYILIEGRVTLTVETGEKTGMMASTIEKEGAIFGMPSLLEPYRYNVTATSLSPSRALVIAADQLISLMAQDPKIGMEVMKKLASIYFNRLNEVRKGLSKFLQPFRSRSS